MTGHIRNIRPARAAIAAVLALSATPLLAQTVMVPPAMPTTAPEGAAPAPVPMQAAPAATAATPAFTAGEPVVQATPPIDERIAAATAAAEAEKAAQRPVVRQRVATPSVSTVTERTPAPQQDRAAPAGTVAAAPVERMAPAPRPAEAAAAMPTPAVTAPTPAETARTDNALLWAMGGGALLLLGLGGTALMRRRRTEDDQVDAPAVASPAIAPSPMVTPVTRTEPMRPAVARQAIAADGSMLEAMVAAPPSADNPFTTRAKRLRRAKFLLAEREATRMPHRAPQTMDAEPAMATTTAPTTDRGQTVYRFGPDRQRPGFLKPRTR